MDVNALESVSQAFLDYSAYNLQRRAIPDARDGLRWSQRQLLHAQSLNNLDYKHPFKKATKSVAAATSFSYTHGPSSAYGIFIRMAKPFVYRVMLQEATGNYGTQIDSESHAADRYVELRGSELAYRLLEDLDKETITEWEDTYDLESKFPRVLPSKGFTNLVNGCQSIGSGMNCSIPPTNLGEVNNALIKLLYNPAAADDEIICLPDLPTGGLIVNKTEVIDSLLHGEGKACRNRAKLTYDKKNNTIVVSELPYQVYTNTICAQVSEIIDSDDNPYIDSINDYTTKQVDLHIVLCPGVNVDRAINFLYKKTALESYISVNMVLLDNGVTPRVFTWREALLAHLEHEKIVYTRGFEYDLKKIIHRIHIINGLLKAIDKIDDVIHIIKASASTAEANVALQSFLEIDEEQAKAILDIKLSRLAHLEVAKLENEKNDLLVNKTHIESILNDEMLLKKEIENGLREVADKFGDKRRTQVIDLVEEINDAPVEERKISVSITNHNNIIVYDNTTKRPRVKFANGEHIISTIDGYNTDRYMFFSKEGMVYHCNGLSFNYNNLESITNYIQCDGNVIAVFSVGENDQYLNFITRKGMIKRSAFSEYEGGRASGIKALALLDGDEVVSVTSGNSCIIGLITKAGYCLKFNVDEVTPTSRVTRGVMAIKLGDDDEVISAFKQNDTAQLLHITTNTDKTYDIDHTKFVVQHRYTRGSKCLPLNNETVVSAILNATKIS